jgi:anaphase-promoting complex subunit 1
MQPSHSSEASPWDELLKSEFHSDAITRDPSLASVWVAPPDGSPTTTTATLRWNRYSAEQLVGALHLVYEDSKLSVLLGNARKKLARLLSELCKPLGWVFHADHYARDFSDLAWPFGTKPRPDEPDPPDIYRWFQVMVSGIAQPVPPPLFDRVVGATERLRKLTRLYSIAFGSQEGLRVTAANVVAAMTAEGIDLSVLDTIPFGVSLPLREACVLCRADPPLHWPAASYELIGRPDLFAQRRSDIKSSENNEELTYSIFQAKLTPPPPPPRPPQDTTVESKRLLMLQQRAAGIRDTMAETASSSASTVQQTAGQELSQNRDGTESDDPIVSMIFPSDKRLGEVRRMLQSTERVHVPITETTGTEWAAEQQEILARLGHRTLSLPVGRGAFTLSLDRMPSAEQPRSPPFNFDGKNLSGHDVALEVKPEGNAVVWPNFHNGVATALRIACGRQRVTHAWISYNQQTELHDTYAGFLLGLGLQGHFPSTPTVKSLELLDTHHNLTMIAVLLSHAVSNAGTMSEAVTKELCMHVPFLRPAAASTLPGGAGSVVIKTETIAAALVGVGFVFRGTGHRKMVEVLLEELVTQPSTRAGHLRECYALCAGLGLGLASLGRGHAIPGAEDLRIVDVLSKLISGGPEPEARKAARKRESAAAAQSQRPSLFATNGWIDTNVTAPGAIMALGMMFMQTNNRVAECELRLPRTKAELEETRPDHLLLRELAKCLVMWSSIEPSERWIEAEVPEFIHRSGSADAASSSSSMFFLDAYGAIVTGACLAMGMRFAGTCNKEAKDTLLSILRKFMAPGDPAITVAERTARANRETHIDNISIVSAPFLSFSLFLALLFLFLLGRGSLAFLHPLPHASKLEHEIERKARFFCNLWVHSDCKLVELCLWSSPVLHLSDRVEEALEGWQGGCSHGFAACAPRARRERHDDLALSAVLCGEPGHEMLLRADCKARSGRRRCDGLDDM